MQVLIISGFLGAGKTTFIRRLAAKVPRQFAVLENEFGQTDIDARLIGEDKDLSVYEMSENCVCCTGKTDFLNTLLAISNSIDPDYLVVEPTGIARLGNILANIRGLGYDRISVLPPVVVVDAGAFPSQAEHYDDIYLDQLRNAGTIVLSKSEGLTQEDALPYRRRLGALNPTAEIVTGDYSKRPRAWWEGLLEAEADAGAVQPGTAATASGKADARLRLPMDTFTLRGVRLPTPVHLMTILDLTTMGLFGDIPRAKGYLPCGSEWVRFDLVDHRWAVTGMSETELGDDDESTCTFIGTGIAKADLSQYFTVFDGTASATSSQEHPRYRRAAERWHTAPTERRTTITR